MKHVKSKVCFCQKEEKCGEIAKGRVSKITDTAHREPPRKAAYIQNIKKLFIAGYVTTVPAFVRAELCIPGMPEKRSLYDFGRNYLLRFYCILLLFDSIKRLHFEMFLGRSIIQGGPKITERHTSGNNCK